MTRSLQTISPWSSVISLHVGELRCHEQHDRTHVMELAESMLVSGLWTHPIVVERADNIILDGHHRVAAAQALGLQAVPCMVVDYDHPAIHLGTWRLDQHVDRDSVRHAALRGPLMPIKTSRHRFDEPVPGCRVPLPHLRGSRHADA